MVARSMLPYDSLVASGAMLDLDTASWTTLPTDNGLGPRHAHTMLWTGSRIIVWGGVPDLRYPTFARDTGAVFDPESNTWTGQIPSPSGSLNVPLTTAVWTGTHLVPVPGSRCYDLAAGVWPPSCGRLGGLGVGFDGGAISLAPPGDAPAQLLITCAQDAGYVNVDAAAPASQRRRASLTLAGEKVVLFAGEGSGNVDFTDALAFDIAQRTWSTFARGAAPRNNHAAVWTGTKLVVWGGDTQAPVGCVLTPP